MAFDIKKLRERIASGEIKPSQGGGSGPKVGEGTFLCLVEESSYGRGLSGNLRGVVVCKVLEGGNDAEVGGKLNIYLQTQNDKYSEETIALWAGFLTELGVAEEKIFDADSLPEIINNICVLANKLALKGKLKLVLKRKLQAKPDEQGRPRYFNDVLQVVPVEDAPAVEPAQEEAPAGPVSTVTGKPVDVPSPAETLAMVAKSQKPWKS